MILNPAAAAVGRILDGWIADSQCNAREADRIVGMIATEDVRRIYPPG